MPVPSKASFRLFKGICEGSIPKERWPKGMTRAQACEMVGGQSPKGLPEKAERGLVLEGPNLVQLGEKGWEYALLAPGSVVAPPRNQKERPTMDGGLQAVLAQLLTSLPMRGKRPAGARYGATAFGGWQQNRLQPWLQRQEQTPGRPASQQNWIRQQVSRGRSAPSQGEIISPRRMAPRPQPAPVSVDMSLITGRPGPDRTGFGAGARLAEFERRGAQRAAVQPRAQYPTGTAPPPRSARGIRQQPPVGAARRPVMAPEAPLVPREAAPTTAQPAPVTPTAPAAAPTAPGAARGGLTSEEARQLRALGATVVEILMVGTGELPKVELLKLLEARSPSGSVRSLATAQPAPTPEVPAASAEPVAAQPAGTQPTEGILPAELLQLPFLQQLLAGRRTGQLRHMRGTAQPFGPGQRMPDWQSMNYYDYLRMPGSQQQMLQGIADIYGMPGEEAVEQMRRGTTMAYGAPVPRGYVPRASRAY